MDDKTNDDGSIKVEDKRRLDADGNTRDSIDENQGKTGSEIHDSGSSDSRGESLPPLTFSSFIVSLATQTLMLLGELSPPHGVKLDVDLGAAKQTIDLLMILKEKTQGNLDTQEAELLEGVLHDAQMCYVRVLGNK